MKSFPLQYAAIALIATVAAAAWVLPVPNAVPSTYVAALAILIGIVMVTALTFNNALPTDTVGQLLQRTEGDTAARRDRSRRGRR